MRPRFALPEDALLRDNHVIVVPQLILLLTIAGVCLPTSLFEKLVVAFASAGEQRSPSTSAFRAEPR